jgi:hypothetical protein
MNTHGDMKNILLAGFSSTSTLFTAVEAQTMITIISAIVLPILFFAVGKAVDVMVQIRFKKMAEKREAQIRIDGQEE